MKYEALNSKFETNSKLEFPNFQNLLNIRILNICACLEFRYSDLVFKMAPTFREVF